MRNVIKNLKPFMGRLIFTVLGLIFAVLFMTLGFAKTMLILLCCGIGYAVGTYIDKGSVPFKRLILWIKNMKGGTW